MGIVKRIYRSLFAQRQQKINPELQGVSTFEQLHYLDINEARLSHLDNLELPIIGKSVIDVGCGIGHLSSYFEKKGCEVFCVDGRPENIRKLNELYPARKASVVDLETQQILEFGEFDIVFCYGLLYHLADPFGFLKKMAKICREMMILETCITDAFNPVLRLVNEDQQSETQALHGTGCRPSSAYVAACLKMGGFSYVYSPVMLPAHAQFQYRRENDHAHIKNGNLIRDIFVASHKEMSNEKLRRC